MNLAGLREQAVIGAFWSLAGSAGQQFLSLLLFVFLAHMLGAQAFGLVAISYAVMEIFNLIGRVGLVEVIVSKRNWDEREAGTAFWLSVILGGIGGILLFAASGLLARVFGEPGLKLLIMIISFGVPLYAVGAVYEALLRREFGFKALAGRNLVSVFGSGVVALVALFGGAEGASLAWMRLAYVALLSLSMIYSTRWVPPLVFDWWVAWRQLRSGSAIAVSSLLGLGNQRVVDLIVGYFLGATALGYLRIAWRAMDLLLELTVNAGSRVALTALARLQDDLPALRRAYTGVVRVTALLVYPLFGGAVMVAPEFVPLVFGEAWRPSVLPMQLLLPVGFFVPLIYYKSSLLTAVGKMDDVLRLNMGEFTVSVLVALAAAQWSMEASAVGAVLRTLLVTPVILWMVRRAVGMKMGATLGAILPASVATALMMAGLFVVRIGLQDALPAVALAAVMVVSGAVFYLATLRVFYFEEMRMAWRAIVVSRSRGAEGMA